MQRVALHGKNKILIRMCLTTLLVHVSGWRSNYHAEALVNSMESPRSRIVVQPCQKAVCNTLQKVLAMIPNRNDLSADRLQMRILALVRSSQKPMEKVKKDAVFIQARFRKYRLTSIYAHRKHASSLTHTHPFRNTSWLHPKPLLRLAPCRPRTIYYRI